MSGGYFGFSHTGAQFGQQQGSYAAQAHGGHVFNPSAAQHTSYVVASTARPSAAAAYETGYSSQQPSQYYSTTTQRHDPQQSAASASGYRQSYSGYSDTSSTGGAAAAYEKQTYYQPQGQHSTQSAYYSSNSGNRGAAAKTSYQTTSHYGGAAKAQKQQTGAYGTGSGFSSNTQHSLASTQKQTPTQKSSSTASYSYSANPAAAFTSSPANAFTQKKYQAQTQQFTPETTDNFSTYEVAVFSAASNYYQQQQAKAQGFTPSAATGAQIGLNKKKNLNQRHKQPPKPTQLHYCDICKISCAGPLTYKEHLEGQKHKKKENALKEQPVPTKSSQPSYRCELCDVTCTGLDAFNAHKRGIKHHKVMKLHTKLGKPIPNTDPVQVGGPTPATNAAAKTTATSSAAKPGLQQKPAMTATKKVVAPKISFVAPGGKSTPQLEEKKTEMKVEPSQQTSEAASQDLPDEPQIQPVGEEYVEEVKSEDGKIVSFNCKLCECRFNDPNAKEMHMKGRRHRLHYKKKVDPSLKVEVKPTLRSRRLAEDKVRRQLAREDMMRRKEEEMRFRNVMRRYEEDLLWRHMEEDRMYEEMRRREEIEYMEWRNRGGPNSGLPPPRPTPPPFLEMAAKKPPSEIDRHVMAKHNLIYPSEEELQSVQGMVSIVEKALKMVSDVMAEADKPEPTSKTEEKSAPNEDTEANKEEEKDQANRIMKGVMRVGELSKGLLLKGDLNMELVVLCTEKPTRTLLERVFDLLPKQMAELTEAKYEVSLCVEEAAIIIATSEEPKMTMKVSLTSPIMRDPEADSSRDPPDVLDKDKCLVALAALRHAKWFQVRAAGLPSCVIVIRVLRDLCDRIPTWEPMKGWPMELLVERVIVSAGHPLSPGDTLRRVFEAVAGGIMLPGGPGVHDPCEREEVDALNHVTHQEREDITASAQHALRLIVFRQVHKVLGIKAMYAPAKPFRYNRKRRREDNESENDGEGKKDKKEGGMEGGSTSGTQGATK